jgi:transposase
MAKISLLDKMRIQTLREQRKGAKAIRSAYPEKRWSLETVKAICRRVDSRGSAVERKKGSGRPKTVRIAANIEQVEQLICSQENLPGTHKSTRQISAELGISHVSVWLIAKKDLNLSSFKRIPGQVLNNVTMQKRLTRCRKLLRRFTAMNAKRLFFTDEKVFYLDPPANRSSSCVWSAGKKKDVSSNRLIRQRAKFSRSVMASAGVCFGGKGRLHFVPGQTKVNTTCYMDQLLSKLIEDCRAVLGDHFIFQQDGAPAHTANKTQDWLKQNTPEFIKKDEWPPNSPDLNPLDYFIWSAMLQRYEQHTPKPKSIDELKVVLQEIWDELPQESVDKAVLAFRKRLRACVRSDGGHFEHLLT